MNRERRLVVLKCLVMAAAECEREGMPDAELRRYAIQYGRGQGVTADEIDELLGMTTSESVRS